MGSVYAPPPHPLGGKGYPSPFVNPCDGRTATEIAPRDMGKDRGDGPRRQARKEEER